MPDPAEIYSKGILDICYAYCIAYVKDGDAFKGTYHTRPAVKTILSEAYRIMTHKKMIIKIEDLDKETKEALKNEVRAWFVGFGAFHPEQGKECARHLHAIYYMLNQI